MLCTCFPENTCSSPLFAVITMQSVCSILFLSSLCCLSGQPLCEASPPPLCQGSVPLSALRPSVRALPLCQGSAPLSGLCPSVRAVPLCQGCAPLSSIWNRALLNSPPVQPLSQTLGGRPMAFEAHLDDKRQTLFSLSLTYQRQLSIAQHKLSIFLGINTTLCRA